MSVVRFYLSGRAEARRMRDTAIDRIPHRGAVERVTCRGYCILDA